MREARVVEIMKSKPEVSRAKMAEGSEDSDSTVKREMKKTILIPTITVAVIALIIVFGKFVLKIGFKQFDSYEEFTVNAPVMIDTGVPEGAADQRFFYKNVGIGYSSFYAFTLEGEDYGKFIEGLVEEYNLDAPKDPDAKYGYTYWYQMKVADALGDDYILDDFPVHLSFNKVIDDDIKDYTIIVYSPVGTGSRGCGVVTNPDTGRIVVYSEGHIK